MKRTLHAVMAAAALCAAGHAAAQITLYEGEGFRGRAITINDRMGNLERANFNDRASSIMVDRGRWEVCEHARFEGRCVVVRRGSYPSLSDLGMNERISSVRPLTRAVEPAAEIAPPLVTPNYEYRQRPSERTYQAPVVAVRAVVGSTPE